jgi:hypothetical protein
MMILIKIGSSQDLNMKHMEEKISSSYCYGPIVQGRLLTHHSRGRHGDEEGLRWWFPSPAGYREELLDPLDLASTMVVAYSMFSRKEFKPLGFSCRGDYIGGRTMSGGGPGGHTPWSRGLALARATIGCGWPLVCLLLSFGLCLHVG